MVPLLRFFTLAAALCNLVACDEVFRLNGPDGSPIDAPPPPVTRWAQVAAGTSSSCGVRLDHTLWCWGRNEMGQLGLGAKDPVGRREPAQVGLDQDWESVSISYLTACAVKTDHTLWCWGDNSDGEIGNNTQHMDPAAPTLIAGAWSSVAVGNNHACGIHVDGSLWCWGSGGDGRLGQGNEDAQLGPTQVPGEWKSVSVSLGSTCAIATSPHTSADP